MCILTYNPTILDPPLTLAYTYIVHDTSVSNDKVQLFQLYCIHWTKIKIFCFLKNL